jgi:hypothetical protein
MKILFKKLMNVSEIPYEKGEVQKERRDCWKEP